MYNKVPNTISEYFFLRTSIIVLIAIILLLLFSFFLLRRKNRSEFYYSEKIQRLTRGIGYTLGAMTLLVILTITAALSIKPKITYPSEPSLDATIISREKPIEIKFDRPVNKKTLKGEISPSIKGNWVWDSGFLKRENKLTFIPDESLALETRYTISLSGIKNFFGGESKYLFSVQTGVAPKILSTNPQDKDEGALPNQNIIIETEPFSSDQIRFDFELNQNLAMDIKQEGSKFTLTPKENLKKGSSYNLKTYRTLISYDYMTKQTKLLSERVEVSSINFKIVAAPGIKKYSPTGSGVLVDSPISIEFGQDMNGESVEKSFLLSPSVRGKFTWQGKRVVIFTPSENFQKNTKYTVTLEKSAKTASDENIEEVLLYSFTTIGPVVVSTISPNNGAKNVDVNVKIQVTFDQAVDHQSAESKFYLIPDKEKSFLWNNNTMTASFSGLFYNQTYEIKISKGVKTVLGLDSVIDFNYSFQTKSQSKTLNVPSYKQSHMYSCMISAARSALAYRGISLSEDSIIKKVGYDNTPWSGTWNEAGSTWGDPDVGIVGDLDGKANNIGWGYGSYWGPISKAITSIGRSNEVKSDMTASSLAAEISAGNPVIIWWVNGVWPSYELSWYKNSKKIRAVNGMHVQVVKGFTGTVEDPKSFSVTDSGYGYPGKTFDTATFLAKWSWFGNTGIIVK